MKLLNFCLIYFLILNYQEKLFLSCNNINLPENLVLFRGDFGKHGIRL